MTSIEWLDEQLQEYVIAADHVANTMVIQISFEEYMDFKRQAKEMHKQEIIDAAERWKGTDFAERYYNEKYRGNNYDAWDEVIYQLGDTNQMIDVPQQEISDEEIEKVSATLDYDHISEIVMWEKGARWYREQLKNKSNG